MSLWLVESREEREEYLPRFIWADQIRYDQSDLGLPLDSSLLLHINIVVRQLHMLPRYNATLGLPCYILAGCV